MKTLKLIIALSLMYISIANAQQDFSGDWKHDTESSTFEINITQTGNDIEGNICAIMLGGRRIDCAAEDEDFISVKGSVNGIIAMVEFFSTYANDWGKATITKISDTEIKWEITVDLPGSFIPSESMLTNQPEE